MKERFVVFDELDAPDLWEESRARTPGPAPGPSAARRSVIVIVALAVFAAAAVFAYQGFRSKPVAQPASRVTNGSLTFLGDDFTGWMVEPDGSNLREIVRPDDVAYAVPVDWSPDGSTVAMYGYLKGHAADYCILLANSDGSNMRPLTAELFAGEGENTQGEPQWSPDGTVLLFTNDSNDPKRQGIYLMTPAGTEVRKIADGGIASWSPDGNYILFQAGSREGTDLFSVTKDGTDLTQLTHTGQAAAPVWSPDGTHIGYVGMVGGETQVFVMNVDGTDQHAVTDIRNDGIGGYSPVWSPDGATLAFELYHDDQWDLYTVRGDGTDLVHLSNDPGDEHSPRWSPDGTAIAFTRSLKPESVVVYGKFDIYTVSADGTDETRVTDGAGVAQGALTWQPQIDVTSDADVDPTPSSDVIELPPLPEAGVAAMWSRANNTSGVSFVGLDGAVVATINDAILYEPGRSIDAVVLVRGDSEHWRLDAGAHRLVRITKAEADELVSGSPGPRLPLPKPGGHWVWVRESPDGSALLGFFSQQVSECSKPVAMIERGTQPAEPITGQPLGDNAQPSTPLGWTPANQALVAVAFGPCGGAHALAEGVYLFETSGNSQRIAMPDGSYYFAAWNDPTGEVPDSTGT